MLPTSKFSLLSRISNKYVYVFAAFWLIIFFIYLPAAKAGWVSDTSEWLQKIRSESFWDYINAKQSRGSAYQFTQLVTYVCYRLLGTSTWLWHILFITLHTANATLLVRIFTSLFRSSGVQKSFLIATGGVLLFTICPHLSETIVWKASFHYLQAMLIMLLILYWLQKYHHAPAAKYAWYAVITYFFATFSHEFFYLTPWFVGTLIIYYRLLPRASSALFKKEVLFFFVPLLVLSLAHVALLLVSSIGTPVSPGDELHQPLVEYIRKPPLYLFHTLFLGRFFSFALRHAVYNFFASTIGLVLFYGTLAVIWAVIIIRFRRISVPSRPPILLFAWLLMCIALVCSVWFPDDLLVSFDRYTYFMLPFLYIGLVFFLVNSRLKAVTTTIFTLYASLNIYFTLTVNRYWGSSARIAYNLIYKMPTAPNKKTLLLNLPEYLNGIPIIGPFWHFSFRQMHNLERVAPINDSVYDVVSYNMTTANDGAHVMVMNDSTIRVTLNQWGTWWWQGMWGAASYTNSSYRFNLVDPGHWYELTLKQPATDYLLLFSVGDKWKTVDMNRKNVDQY